MNHGAHDWKPEQARKSLKRLLPEMDETYGARLESVAFDNTTNGVVTSWLWSFGDGASSAAASGMRQAAQDLASEGVAGMVTGAAEVGAAATMSGVADALGESSEEEE